MSVKLALLLSVDQQFLIEKLLHYSTINLASQSKSMIIVTFGQKCLIKCNYFVYGDAHTFADYGEQGKKGGGGKKKTKQRKSVFCLGCF